MITKTLQLRHDFEEHEINEIAKLMTECHRKKIDVELNKKSATRQYNAEIKYWEREIDKNATLIENGFEDRDVSCEVIYNHPVSGQKTIRRLDTGEEWTEPMTIDEFDLFTAQNVPTEVYADYEEIDQKQLPMAKKVSSPFGEEE